MLFRSDSTGVRKEAHPPARGEAAPPVKGEIVAEVMVRLDAFGLEALEMCMKPGEGRGPALARMLPEMVPPLDIQLYYSKPPIFKDLTMGPMNIFRAQAQVEMLRKAGFEVRVEQVAPRELQGLKPSALPTTEEE